MAGKTFIIRGPVWKYEGPAGWYFVYVNEKISKTIRETKRNRVGWGFVPVVATLGKSAWNTTLFPTKEGPYLIAIKANIRKKEGVEEGDTVRISCTFQ